MRAAWIEKYGGSDVINIGERPKPERPPGEVLVNIRASSLNHHDIYLRRGEAGGIAPPLILGSDGAGTVVSSDSPSVFRPGQRVVIYPVLSCGICINCLNAVPHKCCRSFGMIGSDRDGTQAEFAVVPENCLLAIPEGIDFVTAATVSLAGLTAWNMVVDEAQIRPGEHALVLGASGGVGVFTVRLLKKFGAYVHAVTSSLKKADALRELGADNVIVESPSEVLRFTRKLPQGGVDLAFNCVGGNTWRYIPPATRVGGRILVCGSVRSPSAELDMRQIFYRSLTLVGCTMGKLKSLSSMLEAIRQDPSLRIPVERTIGLEEIPEGHRSLEDGNVVGKIVVCI